MTELQAGTVPDGDLGVGYELILCQMLVAKPHICLQNNIMKMQCCRPGRDRKCSRKECGHWEANGI